MKQDPTSSVDWKKISVDYSLEARREIEHAAEFISQSLAQYAFHKLVRLLVTQSVFGESGAGKSCSLRWYDGVTIVDRDFASTPKRGMILTANDRPILFAFIEGGACHESYDHRLSSALFAIRFLEFSRPTSGDGPGGQGH